MLIQRKLKKCLKINIMSRTKVHTLQDVKEDELVISSTKYKKVVETIASLESKLAEVSESNDINEIEIEYLKNEIKNLVEIANNYKDQIKNQEDLNKAKTKSLERLKLNAEKIDKELDEKQTSKYNKKSKEELRKLALSRFETFKESYKDLL
jgi:conjugal transfer/entry exclusion protein